MLARLKEPSTWAALGAFLTAMGITTGITEETWGQIGTGIAAAASILGIIFRERGSQS